MQAALKGSDAVAVVTEFNNPIYSLVVKPEIKTYADLKGKLIGLAAETGSITISIRKLLAMKGINRDDFRSRFVDGTPDRLVCLTKGDCDAVPLGQPQDFVAMRKAIRLLGLSTEAVPEFVYTVTAARRSWASENKEAVVRYARAMAASFAFIRDPKNREDRGQDHRRHHRLCGSQRAADAVALFRARAARAADARRDRHEGHGDGDRVPGRGRRAQAAAAAGGAVRRSAIPAAPPGCRTSAPRYATCLRTRARS